MEEFLVYPSYNEHRYVTEVKLRESKDEKLAKIACFCSLPRHTRAVHSVQSD